MDFLIFESGQQPRVLTTRMDMNVPRVKDANGKDIDMNHFEFKDAREDDIFGHIVLFNGEKPSTQQVLNAIDSLKPRGLPYQKP